jgi:hypothetical protein
VSDSRFAWAWSGGDTTHDAGELVPYRPVCEIGISDVRQAEPDSWLDISEHVHEAEIYEGRARFTDRFDASTASITVGNDDGWADLFGSPGDVLEQTVRPGRPIRIGIIGPWGTAGADETRWLFRGWIDQTSPRYHPTLHDVVIVNAFDALAEAGSTEAPRGPLQGENETADARITRVLDAVDWFAEKRSIASSAMQVIGTELGSQAIDLMGQAADSAGGVVYGDNNGDVVFRGMGWQLYDGDVPQDFTIGNVDPGTPPTPFIPAYLDPTRGYVYWPDGPPITTPKIFIFDVYPGGGTIISGPDWGIGIWDWGIGPHVIWWNSGHYYDLGPTPTGCWGIYWDPTTGDVHMLDNCDTWQEDVAAIIDGGGAAAPEIVHWWLLDTNVDAPTGGGGHPGGGYLEAVVGPSSGLSLTGPFLLWDTRTWPGGGTIENTGSAADSVWDLAVIQEVDDGVLWQYAYKSATGLSLTPWDELGGPPDSAAITFVVANGPHLNLDGGEAALHAGAVDTQLELHSGTAAGTVRLDFANWSYRERNPAAPDYPDIDTGELDVLWQSYTPSGYLSVSDLAANPDQEYAGVVVATVDLPGRNADSGLWLDETALPLADTFNGGLYGGGTPPVFDTELAPSFANLLVFMSEGAPAVSSGKWQNGTYAFALYRGTPTAEDLAILQDVYGGDTPGDVPSAGPAYPEANALLVFVTVNAPTDVSDDIEVVGTGLSFARQEVVAPGAGEAQGAIWLAPLPDGLTEPVTLTFSWGAAPIDGITWTVYAVANVDEVGATAGAIVGDGTGGSVDGPAGFAIFAGPNSAVFAHLGVQAPWDPDSGAAPAAGGIEEGQLAPEALGYLQTQTRRVNADESLALVEWSDTQTGTVAATSACALAAQMLAGAGPFINWAGEGPITIGSDYTAPIYGIDVYEADGTPAWSFDPVAV